jgi:phosphate transport system permease protein
MVSFVVLLGLLVLGAGGWMAARSRASALRAGGARLRALPAHHGAHAALWIIGPALAVWAAWAMASPALVTEMVLANPGIALPATEFERSSLLAEAHALLADPATAVFNPLASQLVEPLRAAQARFDWIGAVLVALAALAGGGFAFTKIRAQFPARTRIEQAVLLILLAASLVAILTTIGIVASLLYETGLFFRTVSPLDFLTGLHWNPQDPVGGEVPRGYGAVPLFWGTLFIGAVIAMIVAVPLGLMSAIYLTQYASPVLRRWMKPLLEILAGVPTVVYGYFAALTVAPLVRDFAASLGVANPSTESALAAGLVMGVMIIPFVSSMADDSIAAVPQAMRDGSLAMGATESETIKRVMIPAALPGIVAGVMLAISRAIGETMIVVMAAGAVARLSANPFESMTTVTYQIVQMLTGDQEFDSPKTLSAFALGLVLFMVTLLLNIVALRVVKRFREAYE